MNRKTLLEQLTSDIATYVLGGSLSEDDLAAMIVPEGLDDRFSDYDRLVDLHFLLDDEVRNFTEQLQRRIRRIKTETKRQTHTTHGEIDGRIDWEQTYRQRASESPGNDALFVCENRIEHHAIPENLILRALLERIQSALKDTKNYLNPSHEWTAPWVSDGLAADFHYLVRQNVHIQDIPVRERHEITSRMFETALSSRQELYQEAARLLKRRLAYDDGDPDAIRQLLGATAITPEDDDKLFELFVLFRVLETLDEIDHPAVGRATLQSIQSGRNQVATYDGSQQLNVYYNSSGPDDISFIPRPDNPIPGSRGDGVYQMAHDSMSTFFGSYSPRSQRPDILIQATNANIDGTGTVSNPEKSCCVIEIKHSNSKKTIRQGIRELLQYLAFMRRDGEMYFSEERMFGSGSNGLLVIDDLLDDTDSLPPVAQSALPIKIVQASELTTEAAKIFPRIFS